MPKQPTSVRLEEETIRDLKFLADRMRRSQAEVIEELVRERAEREREDDRGVRLAELERRVAELEHRQQLDLEISKGPDW